jgi:uncharacterized radical SAM superfamily protein
MLKFKDGVKGFKYNVEEGYVDEIYTEVLNDAEVISFNKFSDDETIFNNIEDVIDSFGLLVDGEYYLDGWGLDDVVEVTN